MKTTCYCIYCPNHPQFEERHTLGSPVTGFTASKTIWQDKYNSHKAEVDCLLPQSDAFYVHNLDPEDFNYPTTAYGDGCSETGFYNYYGLTLYATCGNETYQD